MSKSVPALLLLCGSLCVTDCGRNESSPNAGTDANDVKPALAASTAEPRSLPPVSERPFNPDWSVFKRPLELDTALLKSEAIAALRQGATFSDEQVSYYFHELLARSGPRMIDWTGPRAIVPISLEGVTGRELYLGYLVTAGGFKRSLLVQREDRASGTGTTSHFRLLSTDISVVLKDGVASAEVSALATQWAAAYPLLTVKPLATLGIVTLKLTATTQDPAHVLTAEELAQLSAAVVGISGAAQVSAVEAFTALSFDVASANGPWSPLALETPKVDLSPLRQLSFDASEKRGLYPSTLPAFPPPFGAGPVAHPVHSLTNQGETVTAFIKHGEAVGACLGRIGNITPISQSVEVYGWALINPKAAQIEALQSEACIEALARIPLAEPNVDATWALQFQEGTTESCRQSVGTYLALQAEPSPTGEWRGTGNEEKAFLASQLECVASLVRAP